MGQQVTGGSQLVVAKDREGRATCCSSEQMPPWASCWEDTSGKPLSHICTQNEISCGASVLEQSCCKSAPESWSRNHLFWVFSLIPTDPFKRRLLQPFQVVVAIVFEGSASSLILVNWITIGTPVNRPCLKYFFHIAVC